MIIQINKYKIDLDQVFKIIRVGAVCGVLLILVGMKDTFVEVFTATPETSAVIAWACLLLFAISFMRL